MRTMKMRRSCRRLDGQVQCGGNDGGGLRGTLGSYHTFSDDTRPHYSHHSARALPISKSQNGRSMCDASPGDDRDGARLTRSCPIHLPPLSAVCSCRARYRGIPESCAQRRPLTPPRSRATWADRTGHRGFTNITLLIGPADRGRSRSRLICTYSVLIVSTEPMREKFTELTPRPYRKTPRIRRVTHDG